MANSILPFRGSLTDYRARAHFLADAFHHGAATAFLHDLGHVALLASASQTAPGPHHAVAAPSHHLRVGHAAEQSRVCV